MLKHYIQWHFAGSFFSNVKLQEVPDRRDTLGDTVPPDGAYGFRFLSRQEVEIDGEVMTGAQRNESPMTYFGEVLTLEQVKQLPGDNRILISNMEGNGWERVVRTILGNFQPLRDGDVVVP